MKLKTIAEAFNHYRTSTLEEIERRAAEIKNIVATDATADVDALNIELEGLSQAKQNVQSRAAGGQQHQHCQQQGRYTLFHPIPSLQEFHVFQAQALP